MEKQINNYSYTNAKGMVIEIRTEKYGVFGFDVYVTIKALHIDNAESVLFNAADGNWYIRPHAHNVMVKPDPSVLKAILADKDAKTEERKAYDAKEAERKRKEREWDNLYNEGAEGFNPYRREEQGVKDNTPMYKGDNDPE